MLPLLALAGGAALAGGVGGMMAGDQAAANNRRATGYVDKVMRAVPGQVSALTGYANQQMSPYTQGAGQDMADYRSTLGQDLSQYNYQQASPFQYDLQGQTQAFLDPSMDYQIQQATSALEGSAANAGKLFSSSTGRGIADRAQAIAQQSWKDALQTALADRSFMAGEDQRNIGNQRAMQDQGLAMWQAKAQGLGNLAGMGQQAVTGLTGMNLGAMSGGYQTVNDANLAKANLAQQRGPTGAAAFFQGLGSAMPGVLSAFGE